jgi:hypothetical protein
MIFWRADPGLRPGLLSIALRRLCWSRSRRYATANKFVHLPAAKAAGYMDSSLRDWISTGSIAKLSFLLVVVTVSLAPKAVPT